MKKSILILISTILFSGCAKIKLQDRLYDDFEEFTQTLQDLPEDLQVNLGKNIAQLENAGYGLIDKTKSAGEDLAEDFRKEFEKGFESAVKDAKREVSDLIELADEIAKERMKQADKITENRINQADKIAGKRIKEVDDMRSESLNKTDTIIQGAISRVDTTIQNAINLIDISMGDKMVLANDLAKEDVKAFMANLDNFVVDKAELANKMLEQRINQVFYRLNKTIKIASNEMDRVLGKNIHRFYYMGDIVAKDLLDAARKSTTMLIIVVIKGIVVILAFLFVFMLIIGVVKESINITPRSITATVLFVLLGAGALFTDVTEKMIGEKYINIDDVFTTAERNFKKVEKIFNSTTPIDTWTIIQTCTETIKGLEMCKVLSPPDNDVLQAYYGDRIEDVNWFLSKSLPEKYLKHK